MIDLHTHILPNIDDGAKDTKESNELINLLYQQGVEVAVCTPHFNPVEKSLDAFLKDRKNSLEQMNQTKLKLIPASEVYFHEYLFYYDNLNELCIKDTNYVLLEFSYEQKWNAHQLKRMKKFIRTYDVIPIIAHIERYEKCDSKTIKKLKDLGCIIQLNTTTLVDKKRKNRALKLIENNLVDVLGSDCHNIKSRPPVFLQGIQEINRSLGMEYSINLLNHSNYIIHGVDIRPRDMIQF